MGIGIRSFIINIDDKLVKISSAKLEKLYRNDPKVTLIDYAGRKIKYVNVLIENQNRKPVDIINIECYYLLLDNNGHIDITEMNNEMRCMGDLIDLPNIENNKSNVINVRRRFAQKKYKNVYKWELTPHIEALIYDEIFNKTALHIVKKRIIKI